MNHTRNHLAQDVGAGEGQVLAPMSEALNPQEEPSSAINFGNDFGDVAAEFPQPQRLLPYPRGAEFMTTRRLRSAGVTGKPLTNKRPQPPLQPSRSPTRALFDMLPNSPLVTSLNRAEKDHPNVEIKNATPIQLGNTKPKFTKNKVSEKISANQWKQAQANKKKTSVKDAIKASIRMERINVDEPETPSVSSIATRRAKIVAAENIKAQLGVKPRLNIRARKPGAAAHPLAEPTPAQAPMQTAAAEEIKVKDAAVTPMEVEMAPPADVNEPVSAAKSPRQSRPTTRAAAKRRRDATPTVNRETSKRQRRDPSECRSLASSVVSYDKESSAKDTIAARVVARHRHRNDSAEDIPKAAEAPIDTGTKKHQTRTASPSATAAQGPTNPPLDSKTPQAPSVADDTKPKRRGRPKKQQLLLASCAEAITVATQTSCHIIFKRLSFKPPGRVTKAKNRQPQVLASSRK